MALVLRCHLPLKGLVALLPAALLHVVQAQVYDRPHALLGPVAAALRVPDGKPLEQGCPAHAVGRQLKKALEHGHGQGLAKAPGAAEEGNGIIAVQQIGHQHRLVHEHRARCQALEPVVANGQAPVA